MWDGGVGRGQGSGWVLWEFAAVLRMSLKYLFMFSMLELSYFISNG